VLPPQSAGANPRRAARYSQFEWGAVCAPNPGGTVEYVECFIPLSGGVGHFFICGGPSARHPRTF